MAEAKYGDVACGNCIKGADSLKDKDNVQNTFQLYSLSCSDIWNCCTGSSAIRYCSRRLRGEKGPRVSG
ncbi:MAG: hypothetical protein ACK53Y_07985, partial [bacterium]